MSEQSTGGVESFPEPWDRGEPESTTVDECRSRAARTGYLGMEYPENDALEEWGRNLARSRNLDNYMIVDESDSGLAWLEPQPTPLPTAPTSTHRPGTCFDQESEEMRGACVDAIQAMLGADEVAHEVRHQKSGYHTDLVYADLDEDGVTKRRQLTTGHQPIHDPLQRFKVWWYLVEYGPKPYDQAVENGVYSAPSKNRTHVDWLLANGYAAKTATGNLVGVKPPKIADLHAVELKLRNWEKALEQADRANRCDVTSHVYSGHPARFFDRFGYADYRWVALDAGAIDDALDHADEFREKGVGLLAIAEGGTVIKHIEAKHEPRRRYTRDRAYVESQIWTKLEDTGPGTGAADSNQGSQHSLGAFEEVTPDAE